MPLLRTFGYQGLQPGQIARLAEDMDALVVDTRFRAFSRAPQWSRSAFQALLGARYRHMPAFGNANFQTPGMENVRLANPEAGAQLLLEQAQAEGWADDKVVLLMCTCAEAERCHRSVVYGFLLQFEAAFRPGGHLLQSWIETMHPREATPRAGGERRGPRAGGSAAGGRAAATGVPAAVRRLARHEGQGDLLAPPPPAREREGTEDA